MKKIRFLFVITLFVFSIFTLTRYKKSNIMTEKKDSSVFTLKTQARDDYKFMGWYLDSSYTNKLTATTYLDRTITTLYAGWTVSWD